MSSGPILNDSLYSDPGNWCAEKNKTYANGYVYVSGVLCMSIGAWKIVADAISVTIATSLLLGLILAATKNRLWYRRKSFKLILHFVSNPLYQWMCQATLLVLQIPYQNDFYLAWAIFFFIQFGSFYTFMGYDGTSTDKQKEVILREWINFTGSINVLWLLLFIYQPPKLRHPFFILWALSVLKIGERVWGFLAADRKYGSKHTKLVALYMASEREDNPEYDPLTMRGYKYLVHKEAESVVCPSNYYARLKTAKVTTLDEVWNCQGRLLKEADKRNGLLKDECLSFALFKLLKRRFEGLSAAEAKERKTRAFLLGLLSEEGERVFRVIKLELGFMSDHLYSKQLVTFGPFLVICNVALVFWCDWGDHLDCLSHS